MAVAGEAKKIERDVLGRPHAHRPATSPRSVLATVKNRLPIPSAFPVVEAARSRDQGIGDPVESVTSQPMVCVPLASCVVSMKRPRPAPLVVNVEKLR
jgi:hypothetical protein